MERTGTPLIFNAIAERDIFFTLFVCESIVCILTALKKRYLSNFLNNVVFFVEILLEKETNKNSIKNITFIQKK